MCLRMHVYMYAYTDASMYGYVYVYVCMHAWMHYNDTETLSLTKGQPYAAGRTAGRGPLFHTARHGAVRIGTCCGASAQRRVVRRDLHEAGALARARPLSP